MTLGVISIHRRRLLASPGFHIRGTHEPKVQPEGLCVPQYVGTQGSCLLETGLGHDSVQLRSQETRDIGPILGPPLLFSMRPTKVSY